MVLPSATEVNGTVVGDTRPRVYTFSYRLNSYTIIDIGMTDSEGRENSGALHFGRRVLQLAMDDFPALSHRTGDSIFRVDS